ncbi:MAG: hypothetical protein ACRDMH_03895 [Solirubrobacterales bacterium]
MGSGAWRGPRGGRRALAALGLVAAAALAGCGSSDFANNPRPSAPIQVAAKIDANRVAISPSNFGAGVVTFTVSNFSKATVRLTLSGPKRATSSDIPPGQPGSLDIELPEGRYRASVEGNPGSQPASFTVGAGRPSSDNKLLLP